MTRAAFHDGGAGAAYELRGRGAPDERHLAADSDLFGGPAGMGDFQLAAADRRGTEGAAAVGAPDGGTALLVNGVAAGPQVDRVMAGKALLMELAAVERERVVARAHPDGAARAVGRDQVIAAARRDSAGPTQRDLVIAVAGDDHPTAKDSDDVIAVASDHCARRLGGDGVPPVADDDVGRTLDVDRVVAIAGDDRAAAEDRYLVILIADNEGLAAGNADTSH